MIRQRKHDEAAEPQQSRSSPSPKKQGSGDDSSGRTAENMQYVSNSRSKARLLQSAPSSNAIKWLFRLRITRLIMVATVIAVAGFMCGRAIHRGLFALAGPDVSFEVPKDLRSPDHGDFNENDSKLNVVNQKMIDKTVQHQDHAHVKSQSQFQQDQIQKSNLNLLVGNQGFAQQQQQHIPHQQPAPDTKPLQQPVFHHNNEQNKEDIVQQHAVPHPVLPRVVVNNPNAGPAQNPQANPAAGQQLPNNILNVVKDAPSDTETYPYHIIQTLTNVHKLPHLKTRFIDCIRSILDKASINLHFFFVVDAQSKEFVMQTLQDVTDQHVAKSQFQFHFIDVDQLAHQLAPLVSMLQEKVTHGHPYYQDAIFFLSVALHRGILPSYVHRVVMLDTDLKFMTDIKQLFDHFDRFTSTNVMAMAHEMQPVYRHLLSMYRNQNKGTNVGDPPPDGLTGFNSGVMLLDLEKMRSSALYHSYINADRVHELATKYTFKGHLGDQDFFTLVSLDQPDLFYVLPCSWNRQLCTWWRDKGYSNVFDQYYRCDKEIHVFHGNCNTPIPV